jgi:hypothetical protein
MVRRVLMSVLAAVVTLAGLLAPDTANAASPASPQSPANTSHTATTAACSSGVSVSQFAFNPSSVPPGGHAPLTLVLQN